MLQGRVPAKAILSGNIASRQDTYDTQASWGYDFAGDDGAAARAFRASVPPDYELVREGDRDLVYVKYDGHDSYHLTLTFVPAGPLSTNVVVLLKSVPD